jgi:Flp pilus assembly protein TadD
MERPTPEEEKVAPLVKAARGLLDQGQTAAAVGAFTQLLQRFPGSPEVLMGLGDCYSLLGEDKRPRELFEMAVRKASARPLYRALLHLGWHCREHGDLERAEHVFQRAIHLFPDESSPYRELGMVYLLEHRNDDATRLFAQAADHGRGDSGLYVLLGNHYLWLKEPAKAEAAFQRAVALNPGDARAYGGLATSYQSMGKTGPAQEALVKAKALRERGYVAMTRENYRRIRQLVTGSGARLVCIQYPRRSLAELQHLFEDPSGIIFVGNEAPFEHALLTAPLTDYFIDFFGGDFGHCTEKGYRLMAQDIADVILKDFPRQ